MRFTRGLYAKEERETAVQSASVRVAKPFTVAAACFSSGRVPIGDARSRTSQSLELVVRELDVVAQVAANEEIRKGRDPK
jgi:hypothetical protein